MWHLPTLPQIFLRLCANPFFRPVIKIVIYATTENPNPLKLLRLSQTNQQGPSANIKSPAQKQLCDDPRPSVAILQRGTEKKSSRATKLFVLHLLKLPLT